MLKNTEAEYSKEGCERKLETIGKHVEIAEKKETSSSGPGRCKIQSIKLNLLHIHLLCPFVPFAHFFVFVRVLQFRSHPFPRKHDNSRLNPAQHLPYSKDCFYPYLVSSVFINKTRRCVILGP